MIVFTEILTEKARHVTELAASYVEDYMQRRFFRSGDSGRRNILEGAHNELMKVFWMSLATRRPRKGDELVMYQNEPIDPNMLKNLNEEQRRLVPPLNHHSQYHMFGVALAVQTYTMYFSMIMIPIVLLIIKLPIDERSNGVSHMYISIFMSHENHAFQSHPKSSTQHICFALAFRR